MEWFSWLRAFDPSGIELEEARELSKSRYQSSKLRRRLYIALIFNIGSSKSKGMKEVFLLTSVSVFPRHFSKVKVDNQMNELFPLLMKLASRISIRKFDILKEGLVVTLVTNYRMLSQGYTDLTCCLSTVFELIGFL